MAYDKQKGSLFSIILTGLIGNVMEWYDFAVYGYFAAVLGKLFFPSDDITTSLLAAFGTFAVGFLMRPLGGIVFGRLGDAVGRQRAMAVSVICMAVPTMLMALLPTYDQIGVWAPLGLIALRIVQGLSVGGEFTSSLIYLTENSEANRRSFTAIWGSWGAVCGMLLGSATALATASMLDPQSLHAWGWRVPFAIGGIVALIGWWVRRNMPNDMPAEPVKSPVVEVFKNYRGHILRIVLINIGYSVSFYTVFVYALTYIRNINTISDTVAFELNTICMTLLLAFLPFTAWLADHLGRRRLTTLGFILLCIAGIPLFEYMHTGTSSQILAAETAFAFIVALTGGGLVVLNVELLPSAVRCTGLAIAYNIAHGVFGGTTPLVAAWLLKNTGNPIAPSYWLIGVLSISAVAMLFWIRNEHINPIDEPS